MVEKDDSPDWEYLAEIAGRRDELNPILLRGLFGSTLVKRGFAAIVDAEDAQNVEKPAQRAPTIVALTLIWSLGMSATGALGLSWLLAPLGLIAAAGALATVGHLAQGSAGSGALMLLGWIGVGVVQIVEGEVGLCLVAYGIPLSLGLIYGLANRLLRLRDAQDVAMALGGVIKSAPLVAPVVLIVLFLPVLSEDVWRVAGGLDAASLLLLALLSVGLLFLVVRVHLGSQVGPMIAQRAQHLSDLPDRIQLTRRQVAVTTESDAALLEEISDDGLDGAWPASGEEYAPYLEAAAGETLAAPLTGRLAVTVGAVGVLFSAYIYLLCSAIVPLELAAEWSKSATPSTHIGAFGISWSLGGGPYLSLAALLGLAATATFLSFALVEERFAQAMTDALLRDPADRLLVVALPYVKLREDQIEVGRRRQVGKDRAAHHQVADS